MTTEKSRQEKAPRASLINIKVDQVTAISAVVCVMLLFFFNVTFMMLVENIQALSSDLTLATNIDSTIQRMVRMEISDETNDWMLIYVDSMLFELEQSDVVQMQCESLFEALIDDWGELKKEVMLTRRVGWESTTILFMSDRVYYQTTKLSETLIELVDEMSLYLHHIQVCIMAVMLGFIVIMIRKVVLFVKTIQRKEEVSHLSFVDIPTGTYNRARCEQLFHETTFSSEEESILFLFDLNDLKVVNDTLGHLYGDDLIKNFALIIQQAGKMLDHEPFIGRYGGDEFIVYLTNTNVKQAKHYRAHVHELADAFNRQDHPYLLSFANGFVSSTELSPMDSMITMMQIADERMYENKGAIKRLRKKHKDAKDVLEG